jgi:hypothetical protein
VGAGWGAPPAAQARGPQRARLRVGVGVASHVISALALPPGSRRAEFARWGGRGWGNPATGPELLDSSELRV